MSVFKEITFDEQLGEYITKDDRVFSNCVEFQLKQIRSIAKELILQAAPEYKQRNAALGLLSQQEMDEIKNSIQIIRNQSNTLEAQINAIVWDGQESTRTVACDAVQSIVWS